MSNLANRMHFEFRSYPSASSPEGILFNYLKTDELHPSQTKNDLVLKALKLCWMPHAYRETGLKHRDLKKLALSTIHSLEWHIQEIRLEFGLDSVPPPPVATYLPLQMHHNAFNAAMAPNPIENLVHNDDAVEADEADEWESVMGL
jgi:hypothetical protein